jgi:hypothetical protein
MFDNNEIQVSNNSNEWNKWIEKAIDKKYIKYYEYKLFYNIEKIGNDDFGKVYCAKWENLEQYLILKSFYDFDNVTVKEIMREVMMKCDFFLLYTNKINRLNICIV